MVFTNIMTYEISVVIDGMKIIILCLLLKLLKFFPSQKQRIVCVCVFQRTDCQKLETFRAIKHHLEDLMARKTGIAFDHHPNFKAMIETPIVEWAAEAAAVIENGTGSLMDSFRLIGETVRESARSVKRDIENDRKTKKM